MSEGETPSSYSPWPHRIAVILACATFPLLFIGGLVTSLGVGLAVPDWPTTFGHNMFLYPWSKMIGGIFYEHSHRLVASTVGLLTIGLAVTFWLYEQRRWLRWLGFVALGLVIAQGVLGGLRVVLLQSTLAMIHACLAQAFFALTVSLALFTSAEWRGAVGAVIADGGRLRRLAIATTALIYLQIIFGAVLRHSGEWLEAHLLIAVLVSLHVFLLGRRISLDHPQQLKLARPARQLRALLVLQLALGTLSYFAKFAALLRWPFQAVVLLTTTHLIIGALMFALALVITLRVYRLSRPAPLKARAKLLAEQYSV